MYSFSFNTCRFVEETLAVMHFFTRETWNSPLLRLRIILEFPSLAYSSFSSLQDFGDGIELSWRVLSMFLSLFPHNRVQCTVQEKTLCIGDIEDAQHDINNSKFHVLQLIRRFFERLIAVRSNFMLSDWHCLSLDWSAIKRSLVCSRVNLGLSTLGLPMSFLLDTQSSQHSIMMLVSCDILNKRLED